MRPIAASGLRHLVWLRPSPCRRVASAPPEGRARALRIHQQAVAKEYRSGQRVRRARQPAARGFSNPVGAATVRFAARRTIACASGWSVLLDGCRGRSLCTTSSVTLRCHDLHDVRLAEGECTRLVENDNVELRGVLERRGVPKVNAVHRAQDGSSPCRHRRRESQRIRQAITKWQWSESPRNSSGSPIHQNHTAKVASPMTIAAITSHCAALVREELRGRF